MCTDYLFIIYAAMFYTNSLLDFIVTSLLDMSHTPACLSLDTYLNEWCNWHWLWLTVCRDEPVCLSVSCRSVSGPDIIFSTALLVKAQRNAGAVTVWTCWHVSLHSTVLELSLYIHRDMWECVLYSLLNIEQFLFNVNTYVPSDIN